MLRDAIYDNRISYYSYEPFLTEIKRVEMDQKKKKVDQKAAVIDRVAKKLKKDLKKTITTYKNKHTSDM